MLGQAGFKIRYVLLAVIVCAGILTLYHAVEMVLVDEAHFPRGWGGDLRYTSKFAYVMIAVVESLFYFGTAVMLLKCVRFCWIPYGLVLLAISFFLAHFL